MYLVDGVTMGKKEKASITEGVCSKTSFRCGQWFVRLIFDTLCIQGSKNSNNKNLFLRIVTTKHF